MRADLPFELVEAETIAERSPNTVGQPWSPDRRVLGLLVLLLATIGALVIPAATAPDVVGRAGAAPLPLPPSLGSCVVVVGDAAHPDSVSAVPCDEPHSGEIVMTWPAGQVPGPKDDERLPVMTFSVTRSLPGGDADPVCQGWTSEYVGWTSYLAGHRSDLWIQHPPLVASRMLRAPDDQGLPDRHWTACLVQTSASLYVGTVRGAVHDYDSARPAALSVCLTTRNARLAFPDCDQAHTAELLASVGLTQDMMFDRSVEVSLSADEIHRQCVTLAGAMTGSTDPTYGGRLQIVTRSVWQLAGPLKSSVSPTGWLIPDCLVTLVGSGELVGSVIGLGNSPLPVR